LKKFVMKRPTKYNLTMLDIEIEYLENFNYQIFEV
jgi:hypothetical protein